MKFYIFLHFGWQEKFRFLPRYTRNGDSKISTEEDVIDFLDGISAQNEIKNIFVWGSPPMNNLFQQATSKIWSIFKFKQSQIEII